MYYPQKSATGEIVGVMFCITFYINVYHHILPVQLDLLLDLTDIAKSFIDDAHFMISVFSLHPDYHHHDKHFWCEISDLSNDNWKQVWLQHIDILLLMLSGGF